MKRIQTVKKRCCSLLVLMGVVSGCQVAEEAVNASAHESGYQLVWSDEFEQDGRPNPANWRFEQGFVRNNEHQWYQESNAFVENGLLVIEGRKERFANPNYDPHSKDWRKRRPNVEYTSASLLTRGLQQWQYGRFEIKARLKAEEGLWPAIWFLGEKGEWPSNGEIDLMEYYDDSILANVAWGTQKRYNAKWDSAKVPMETFNDPNWDTKFHIWRMDWTEERIELYLDDQLLNETDLSITLNPTDKGPKNPFKQPAYMLLNLALGGNRGGSLANTAFPSRYEIDYVRVYEQVDK